MSHEWYVLNDAMSDCDRMGELLFKLRVIICKAVKITRESRTDELNGVVDWLMDANEYLARKEVEFFDRAKELCEQINALPNDGREE